MRKWILTTEFAYEFALLVAVVAFVSVTLFEGWQIGFIVSLVAMIVGGIIGFAVQMIYAEIMDTIEYRNYLREKEL